MLKADTQRHTKNMTMLKFGFQKAFLSVSHAIFYLYYRTVHPSVRFIFELADRMSRYMTSYIWRPPKHRSFPFPTVCDNNMADTRICELVTTQDSLTWGKSINVYWSWNIIHCLQWRVFEVQGEGKFTVQLPVLGFVLEWKCVWMDVPINWHWMWSV